MVNVRRLGHAPSFYLLGVHRKGFLLGGNFENIYKVDNEESLIHIFHPYLDPHVKFSGVLFLYY
jgi:hypothetical protein